MSIHPRTKSIYIEKEIPQEDKIWTTIPGSQKCKVHSFETRTSNCVTNILRNHNQDERETDGAMHWNVIPPVLKGRFKNQLEKEFTDEDWLHCFQLGSFKTRFEICEDENGELKYIRAIQGHSGGVTISPRLMNYVRIPHRWKQFIYHVGRARDQYSVAEAGPVAGGKERKEGRQIIFFTPLDPSQQGCRRSEKPRKVHYQIHWRPEQDAVKWIHLSKPQDAGLEFWRTGSNAIITYQSVPKECVVKVVSESGKRDLFARQLTPRERPKVTLRASWVHERSNNLREPQETESKVQTWSSNPIPSRSRNWPKEKSEQSVDLRVDGSPNDETYKDEQYMQRICAYLALAAGRGKFECRVAGICPVRQINWYKWA